MQPNAEYDPIVQAGVVRCQRCGRVAFPTDAERLDAALIIATYPAPCHHGRPRTLVIDLDDLPAAPVAPELSAYVRGRRCAGRNRSGRPCRAYADPGSDFCQAHVRARTTRDPA